MLPGIPAACIKECCRVFERRLLLKGKPGLVSITFQTSIKQFSKWFRYQLNTFQTCTCQNQMRQRICSSYWSHWDVILRLLKSGIVIGMGITIGVTQSPSPRFQPLHNYPKSAVQYTAEVTLQMIAVDALSALERKNGWHRGGITESWP